ncbi:MAG: orotate phosphoribosyltransferase, partial [Thermoplasmata archaeon]
VLVVVDREEGGRENLSKENLELISLIKVSSLLSKYGK